MLDLGVFKLIDVPYMRVIEKYLEIVCEVFVYCMYTQDRIVVVVGTDGVQIKVLIYWTVFRKSRMLKGRKGEENKRFSSLKSSL